MRRLVRFTCAVTLVLAALLIGVRGVGNWVAYPFNFSNRHPIGIDPPYDQLLPNKLGPFVRYQIVEAVHGLADPRLLARGSAIYTRGAQKIYIELKMYRTAQIAALLFDPQDWPPHSRTQDKYFVRGTPISFIFTHI